MCVYIYIIIYIYLYIRFKFVEKFKWFSFFNIKYDTLKTFSLMVGRGYTCIHMQYLQGWSPCLHFTRVCLYLCVFIWRALLVLPNSVVVPTQMQAGEQAYTSLYTYYIKRPLSMCNTSDLLTLLTHLMLRHLEFIFVFLYFVFFVILVYLFCCSWYQIWHLNWAHFMAFSDADKTPHIHLLIRKLF